MESKSDANIDHNVGHQEKLFNFHHLHNQSTVRSRGFNIGNPVVGLPPGAPSGYYTQPGSPYNDVSIRPRVNIGDLDEGKEGSGGAGSGGPGRPYKSEKWADRLRTPEEKKVLEDALLGAAKEAVEAEERNARRRRMTMAARGAGTVAGGP